MCPYLMDSDHVSLISRGGILGERITARIAAVAPKIVAVSIVSYEEQMRGWMAEIARMQSADRQMTAYSRLEKMRDYYCTTPVLPFSEAALKRYQDLWVQRLRVGTMDLKIAAVALSNNSVLITRNRSDFGKIPSLVIEDWSL